MTHFYIETFLPQTYLTFIGKETMTYGKEINYKC